MGAVIFLNPPLGGVNTPLVESQTPPPTQSHFLDVLMFFNVNLRFAHVYTPPNICLYPTPPQFQIPRNNPDGLSKSNGVTK